MYNVEIILCRQGHNSFFCNHELSNNNWGNKQISRPGHSADMRGKYHACPCALQKERVLGNLEEKG